MCILIIFVLIVCLGLKPTHIDTDELVLPSLKNITSHYTPSRTDKEIIMDRFNAVLARSKQEGDLILISVV